MNILLTNDDSHDSPLLHMIIDHLDAYGDVTIVVPAEEQSWKGKSMSRFGTLTVEEIALFEHRAYAVTGTPADCVNLGIYNLMSNPPDIVVSGVNLGLNTGLGFLMASGTVGACFEANIAGVPALALSQELHPDDMRHWYQHRSFEPSHEEYFSNLLNRALPVIWQALVVDQPTHHTTWSVNLPKALADERPILTHARLGRTVYGPCFLEREDGYVHSLRHLDIDPDPQSDQMVLKAGHISVTHLDLDVLGQEILAS